MKKISISVLSLAISSVVASTASAETFTEALTGGKAFGDVRFRYEAVEQNNTAQDADALTVRTRIGYKTGSFSGFSALVEFEDVRTALGIDDYNVPVFANRPEFSVIADPEVTELDQGFVQYKNDFVTAKLGRQVLTYDNHRFVGHVGWRQDRQTFDALSLTVTPIDGLSLSYANLYKRNRILGEAADFKSNDNLLNASYQTPFGKLTGYAYLLENEGNNNTYDTYGVRFAGAKPLSGTKLLYTAEFATQTAEIAAGEFDADYLALEGGVVVNGITAKLGYELLGSDGAGFGFATPLATLHKFNGWADAFLNTPPQGLEDVSLTLATKVAGVGLKAIYHDFSSDESNVDFGDELDLAVTKAFSKNYSGGIKYAMYSAGDAGTGKVDTDKLWLWVSAKF